MQQYNTQIYNMQKLKLELDQYHKALIKKNKEKESRLRVVSTMSAGGRREKKITEREFLLKQKKRIQNISQSFSH